MANTFVTDLCFVERLSQTFTQFLSGSSTTCWLIKVAQLVNVFNHETCVCVLCSVTYVIYN